MLRRKRARRHASGHGSALVELAVVLPVLVVLLVGTADFARVFYLTLELTNAARAAAQYGTYDIGKFNDDSAIQAAAVNASPNIPGFSSSNVAVSRLCQCATDAGAFSATSPANSCSGTCSGGGHIVATLTVTASKTFTPISRFPGIPNTLNLNRTATLRAP